MSTCEIALGVLVGVTALLTLGLGYWISTAKALEASKAFDKEPKIKFTGVPIAVFKDRKVVIYAQEGARAGTLVVVIRVIIAKTGKLYSYTHTKEQDQYVRIPEVGAVMVIKKGTVEKVVYPLEIG